jgi:NAD-dependent dihydropyrimidine dehydrogenase PreA subunit
MAYVITGSCTDVLDKSCIQVCPVDCIYEGDRKMYVSPDECIDCGACEPECPVDAIAYEDDVKADAQQHVGDNRAFFSVVLPGRDTPLGTPGGAVAFGRVGADTVLVANAPANGPVSTD